MTNMQAALGLAQFEFWDYHIAKKRAIGKKYREAFQNLAGFQFQAFDCGYAENIYWVFGLVAETEELCNKMMGFLHEKGIGTRPFFWCMHEQPVFTKMGLFSDERYPVAEKLARNGFYIPSGLGIEDKEMDHVIEMINCFSN